MKLYNIFLAFLLGVMLPATAQETSSKEYSIDGKHRGLDFSINSGYNFGVGDNKKLSFLPFELGLGKQFHPNLYVGLRTGAWVGISDKAKAQIPIMSDFKVMFPSKEEGKIKPIINLRLGYLLQTGGGEEYEADNGEGGTINGKYEAPDMIMMEFMPGIQIPLSNTTDFMLSVGYAHGFATKGGGNGGYFGVKAGINFHKRAVKRGPREKVGTRDKGLQYTIEGEGNNSTRFGGGANLVFTYKLNPHVSIGVGGGYHAFSPYKEDGSGDDFIQYIQKGEEEHLSYYGDVRMLAVFARGNYRLTDKRLSPIGSVDAGIRSYDWEEDAPYGYGYRRYSNGMLETPSKTTFFIAPSVGLSFRTTKNSYLELKVGYNISPKLKAIKIADFEQDIYYSTHSKTLSYGFISIGFTHTLGKRGVRRPL